MKRLVDRLRGGNLTGWKRRVFQLVLLSIGIAVGGFLVAASGIMPIKASSGHWPITAWFLSFSMDRSVSTHALSIETPSLDEPAMIADGAAIYDRNCFPCHGSPALWHPRVAAAMTPPPPYLPPNIDNWKPRELFYIVKHGVKFTGMPAWPTQHRDDEVWTVVSFLQKFPELDESEYQHLVAPNETSAVDSLTDDSRAESSRPQIVQASCVRCHGERGRGRDDSHIPKLAGQQIEYIAATLRSYADGSRHSGIMEPIAATLSSQEIHEIARYYSEIDSEKLDRVRSQADDSADAIEQGQQIAFDGIPSQKVAACHSCHGPSRDSRNSHFPDLAGQPMGYLVEQLQLIQQSNRGGTQYIQLMHPVAKHLKLAQIQQVAAYYHSLTER